MTELRFGFHTPTSGTTQPADPPPADNTPRVGTSIGDRLVPAYEISINGQPLPDSIRQSFIGVEVRQSIQLATMFVLRFHNPGGRVGDDATFDHGGDVEVKLGYLGALETVAKGSIVSVEPVFPQNEDPYVVIRGYGSGSTKLSQGKKTRTFLQQKVSDVVQQLGQEEGLQCEIDDTSLVHDYLLQNNQSNLEFIQELGRRHHVEVEVVAEEGKLRFQKPGSKGTDAGTYEWGKDLKSFYVRKKSSDVHGSVVTKGWDPATKKAITGTDKDLAAGSSSSVSPDKLAGKFGSATHQVSIRPVSSTDEANALSHAAFNEKASEAQTGKGTVLGSPDVKPGSKLELKGLGAWSGKYYVTNTVHLFHPDSGYVTEFFVKFTDPGEANKPAAAIPPVPPDTSPDPTHAHMQLSPRNPNPA